MEFIVVFYIDIYLFIKIICNKLKSIFSAKYKIYNSIKFQTLQQGKQFKL